MKNILLTGFQPFGGLTDNPSARIVYVMDGAVINGHQVVARTLPVTFKDAPVCLEQLMETYQPELVLCLGLAVGGGNTAGATGTESGRFQNCR